MASRTFQVKSFYFSAWQVLVGWPSMFGVWTLFRQSIQACCRDCVNKFAFAVKLLVLKTDQDVEVWFPLLLQSIFLSDCQDILQRHTSSSVHLITCN